MAAVLLLVAAFLVFGLDGDDAEGDAERATAVCEEYRGRIQREFELSFPEGVPSEEASAEYLSHAFADTMDELAGELRALPAEGDLASAVDALEVRLVEIRATPEQFVDENPFGEVASRFDALGAPACGSEFFADPE